MEKARNCREEEPQDGSRPDMGTYIHTTKQVCDISPSIPAPATTMIPTPSGNWPALGALCQSAQLPLSPPATFPPASHSVPHTPPYLRISPYSVFPHTPILHDTDTTSTVPYDNAHFPYDGSIMVTGESESDGGTGRAIGQSFLAPGLLPGSCSLQQSKKNRKELTT